jgi:hypothetical protein
MPRLRYMQYCLSHNPNFRFEFEPHASSEKAEWQLYSLYRPDQRVAEAWKCSSAELDAKFPARLIKTIIADWDQHLAESWSIVKD